MCLATRLEKAGFLFGVVSSDVLSALLVCDAVQRFEVQYGERSYMLGV